MGKVHLFPAMLMYILALLPTPCSGSYTGFKELKVEDCVALRQEQLQRLPPAWSKYQGFIKLCPFRKSLISPPKVSVISVWAHDYLNVQKVKVWEEFPLPILVDDNMRQLGTLPELFPMDSRTEPIVYFGKWKSGMPTEILVDIHDPTVSGDYYYSPLIWNPKEDKYRMIDQEPKSGPRPKR